LVVAYFFGPPCTYACKASQWTSEMTYIVSGGALNSTHSWTLGSRHSSRNCCRTTALLSALTSFNLCSLQLHFSAFLPIMFVAVLQTVGDCSHVRDGPRWAYSFC